MTRITRALLAALALALCAGTAFAAEDKESQEFRLSIASTTSTADVTCAKLDVSGMGRASFDVTGTWAGTVTFRVMGASGTLNTLEVAKADSPGSEVTTTTANGVWGGDVAGYDTALACLTSWTSGAAQVKIKAAGTGGGGGGGGGAGGGGDFNAADFEAAFGTAGTPDSQVLSVQGVASMTPLATNITQVLGVAFGASNPLFTCIVSFGGSACITIPDAVTVDLNTAGTQNVEGFAILTESASGGVAVGPNNPLTVDLGANNDVQGNVAHDSPASGSPFTIAYTAVAHGADPTAVAAGDVTRAYANRDGVPFVLGGHPHIITLESQVQDADGAQTDLALVTCGSGCVVVVTEASVTCDPDTSDDTSMRMGFGTANVPSGAHTGTAGVVLAWDGVPQGGGRSRGSGSGIVGIGADGEDLRLTIADPVGGSCNILVSYFTIES